MSTSQNLLIKVKIEALLHDPPHKSLLIGFLRGSFGKLHAEEAKTFRNMVLAGTRFAEIDESAKRLASICDRLASATERRIITAEHPSTWPRGIYLKYDYLHNIFNPSEKINIKPQSITSINVLSDKVKEVAFRLNRILRSLDPEVDSVTLYNALYALLEPMWYSSGLPPSLADTRVPTHTTFDHLYASASIANIVAGHEPKLKGYYVLVDFPGIQKFIGAGRKVGDFWAGSWLLSNLMWGLTEEFTSKYGFDVLISPTPRLNPYTLKSLEKQLRNKDVIEDLKKSLAGALGLDLKALEFVLNQPIIPATISLLLTSFDFADPNDIVDKISRAFNKSWESLLDHIREELNNKAICEKRGTDFYNYMITMLNRLHDVLEIPPYGIRIYVVNIEPLHKALHECLVGGVIDKCELLELNVNQEELANMPERIRKELSTILLWHLVTTRTTTLARVFGSIRHPIPRAFFTYSHGKLTPISPYITSPSKPGDWIHCTLCGIEPAVIRASKKPGKPEEYSEDFVKEVISLLSRDNIDWLEFKKHIKPGEAIGPYCLLKRAIYLANIDKLSFVSTDNIALEGLSHIIKHLEKHGTLELLRTLSELREPDTLVDLLEPSLGPLGEVALKLKEIGITAEVNGLPYDIFVSRAESTLRKVCKEAARKDAFVADLIAELKLSITGNIKNAEKIVYPIVASPHVLDRDKLCRALRFKTTYAIIRADADNIGEIRRGIVNLDAGLYLNELFKAIEESSRQLQEDIKISILRSVRGSFNLLKHALKAVNFKYLPVTPAWTSTLSLALMISTIRDMKTIHEGYGILIFSGGDDLLAIVPPETAFKVAIEVRSRFSDEPFTSVNSKGLVAPAILTGRSISLRFTDIKDSMNYEFAKTLDLLEEYAKRATWTEPHREEYKKDGLIISDSKSGIKILLPLNRKYREITEMALALSYLVALGALSTSIPEDFTRVSRDLRDMVGRKDLSEEDLKVLSRGLKVLARRVLRRNIGLTKGLNGEKISSEILKLVEDDFEKASNIIVSVNSERYNLLTQLLHVLAIMRRHL